MATRMQQRRGTAQQWLDANPVVLAAGEIGFETDTNQFKIGDGSTEWQALSYFKNLADLDTDGFLLASDKAVANGVASLDGSGQVPISQLGNIIDGAPNALNTLNELAAALGDDENFASYIINSLAEQDQDLVDNVNALNLRIDNVETDLANTANTINDRITNDLNDLDNTFTQALAAHDTDTSVHGIANTLALVDLSTLANEIGNAVADAGEFTTNAISDHNLDTSNVHGIANTLALVETTDSRLSDERTPSNGSVTADKIASDAVETAKLANNAVTNAKIADDAVDTAEIKDGAVTNAKLAGSIAQSKITDLETDLQTNSNAISSHSSSTANVHGIANTAILFTTEGGTISGSVTITGDLTVTGNTVTVSANSLVVNDPLIYMGEDNNANSVDLGIVASFDDGTYQHTGLVRDASDNTWKLFKGVTDEPTTTINFSQGSLDNISVNNITAAGVIFTDGTQSKEGVVSRTPIIQKTASYTLSALTERDSLIEVSSASGTTVTIPAESSVNFPIGTSIDILQTSTGQVTIAGAGGVTVNATPGLKLRTQWSSATLFKRAADTWVVFGDLSA